MVNASFWGVFCVLRPSQRRWIRQFSACTCFSHHGPLHFCLLCSLSSGSDRTTTSSPLIKFADKLIENTFFSCPEVESTQCFPLVRTMSSWLKLEYEVEGWGGQRGCTHIQKAVVFLYFFNNIYLCYSLSFEVKMVLELEPGLLYKN